MLLPHLVEPGPARPGVLSASAVLRTALLAMLLATPTPSATASPQERPTAPLAPAEEAFLERVAELAKALPPRSQERGDGVIRGRVVTEAGEPLEGARIWARWLTPDSERTSPSPFPEVEPAQDSASARQAAALVATLRAALATPSRVHETTSAADGTFALERLPEGRFQLQTAAAGHALLPVRNPTRYWIDASPGEVVDYFAIPTIEWAFDLRLPDGSVPPRAMVEFARQLRNSMPFRQSWSPAAPAITLPVGDWEIRVRISESVWSSSDDDVQWSAAPRRLSVPLQAPSEPLRIELTGHPSIHGRIRGRTGTPTDSPTILAERIDAAGHPIDGNGASARRPRRPTEVRATTSTSGASGMTYRLNLREAGRWQVTVTLPGASEPILRTIVEVGAGPVALDLDLAAAAAAGGALLLVTVRDPDGTLLPWCEFERIDLTHEAGKSRTPQRSSQGLDPMRQTDGRFALTRAPFTSRNALVAKHPRFGEIAATFDRDAESLELQFEPPVQVTLELAGLPDPLGTRDFELELTLPDDGSGVPRTRRMRSEEVPSDRRLDLGALRPGRLQAWLTLDPDRTDSRTGRLVAAAEWTLAAGSAALTLTCPPVSTFSVQLGRHDRPHARLLPLHVLPAMTAGGSAPPGTWAHEATATADGDAAPLLTFRDVPPGRWQLDLGGDRFMIVTTPLPEGSGPLPFGALLVTALRVRLTAADSALAKAGLAEGDLVVALDGAEFRGQEELGYLRSRIQSDRNLELLTLTVRRGADHWFETVIPKAHLSNPPAAGGLFEATTLDD